MAQTRLKLGPRRIGAHTYWQLTIPRPGGGRIRKTFKSRATARREFKRLKKEIDAHGVSAGAMSDRTRAEASEAQALLAPYGVSILEAAREYAARAEALKRSRLLSEAIDTYIEERRIDGAAQRTIEEMNHRLGCFRRDLALDNIRCASVTVSQLEDWLRGLGVGAVTRNAYRKRLHSFFAYAKARDWCPTNPVANVAIAKVRYSPPIGILSVEQLGKLLECAHVLTRPYWAIGAFAGVRTAELLRLERRDIHYDSGLIEIGAHKAKSASKRFIKIEPVLAAWLEPYRTWGPSKLAPLSTRRWRTKLLADRKAAGIEQWPPNALRHSFASYHLAHFHDASRLALEMGHTNASLIFRHYREVVLPTEAAKYWNLFPAQAKPEPIADAVA